MYGTVDKVMIGEYNTHNNSFGDTGRCVMEQYVNNTMNMAGMCCLCGMLSECSDVFLSLKCIEAV